MWKKVSNGAEESATEKMRKYITRIARRAKKPRHSDFQDTMPKTPLPYPLQLLIPSSAGNLLPACRCLKGPWEAVSGTREDNGKRGKWKEKETGQRSNPPPWNWVIDSLSALNMGLPGELRAPSTAGRVLGISSGSDQKITGFSMCLRVLKKPKTQMTI